MTYLEKLKDPRWQKKRLEIFQRDFFACKMCKSTEHTLHVHHKYYESGKEPWEYRDEALVSLCEHCHEQETLMKDEPKNFLMAWKDAGTMNMEFSHMAFMLRRLFNDMPSGQLYDIINELYLSQDFLEQVLSLLDSAILERRKKSNEPTDDLPF